MASWNPWHGCHKISAGCAHCYVYRMDEEHGKDSSIVAQTGNFNLPLRRSRNGAYKLPAGEMVFTCLTSDFFLEEADAFRPQAWAMIKERSDTDFTIITKRIDRFCDAIPPDWGEGYENVHICCTTENQDRADYRLPIFKSCPIRHKSIICEPLLEEIDLSPYLDAQIKSVTVGGESGADARICNYDWVLAIRHQCVEKGVAFDFKQTGAHFLKDGKFYQLDRELQHAQAKKAGIDFRP